MSNKQIIYDQTEQTVQTVQTEQTDQTEQTEQTDQTEQTVQTVQTEQTDQTEQTEQTVQTIDKHKYKQIDIYQLETTIKNYLLKIHPHHSNGFVIRILDIDSENPNYERRRSYIVTFPYISNESELNKEDDVNKILNTWSEYAMFNVVENYNFLNEISLLSIDPINISKNITDINIQFSGSVSNPELLIRSLTFDIIEQMNKHLIEYYMDIEHPEVDINDSEQLEEFNKIFDDIDIEAIYERFKFADVYIPIEVKMANSEKRTNNLVFYVNGTIRTDMKHIDIIDEIRSCIDFNDKNEILKYDKEEIVYKFGNNKKVMQFEIITDPDI